MTDDLVLSVSGLTVEYRGAAGAVTTVRDVGFDLRRGRICGVAGESGSGKSTAALAAMGWDTPAQHRIAGVSALDGFDLCALPPKRLREVWGARIGYVPQEIGGALHPSYRIGGQFRETMKVNRGADRKAADERAIELLTAARVPDPAKALRKYPHEFSGGQLQRIAIALALAPHPDVLILDEPTTGLDVTTQQAVVGVLRTLVADQRVAAMFISHDLALLAKQADDLVIMYAGEVVESGPAAPMIAAPRHPYTRALLDAVPAADHATVPRSIPGLPPGRVVTGGCSFAARCPHREDRCDTTEPPLLAVNDRLVRCLRAPELDLAATAPVRRQTSDDSPGVSVLEVRGLRCAYRSVVAAEQVSFAVPAGGVLALVGESGSGKTTVGRMIAGALRPDAGEILLDGRALPADPARRTRADRRAIQLIFQNPSGSLNPRRTVGDQLHHIARLFVDGTPEDRRDAVLETLRAVQLSPTLLDRYPRQLSGGQRQRVAIAAAFIARPRIVVCDEITSGQDVSVQAAILDTLTQLRHEFGTAVVFISHDLGVVRAVADQVHVLRDGRVVESGPTETVFTEPRDAYTRELLAAVPRLGNADTHTLEGSSS